MDKGVILKGIAGFYYVSYNSKVYECKARGRIKNKKITPLVGDYVKISILDEDKLLGTIDEIYERHVELIRPSVSNVDQAVIVFSAHIPEPNTMLLDKLTVLAEYSNLDIVICMNKCDLDPEDRYIGYRRIFEAAGYRFVKTSTVTGQGIDELKEVLKDKINVFSGPSGVGKSSLLNELEEGLKLKTGSVSEKIKRGRHTTRHSELFELSFGGFVVDTPGFTSLDLDFIPKEELAELFPDFNIGYDCKFHNCLHLEEPECGVKEGVKEGKIEKSRYDSYLNFMSHISNSKIKY